MNHFHTNIAEGKTVSESLSDAKRKYINEAVSKNVHPFYWAGFIQIGNSENYDNSFNFNWLYLAISIILFFGIIFFKKNKK